MLFFFNFIFLVVGFNGKSNWIYWLINYCSIRNYMQFLISKSFKVFCDSLIWNREDDNPVTDTAPLLGLIVRSWVGRRINVIDYVDDINTSTQKMCVVDASNQNKIRQQHIHLSIYECKIKMYFSLFYLLPTSCFRDMAISGTHLRHKTLHQCNIIVVQVSTHVEWKKLDPP